MKNKNKVELRGRPEAKIDWSLVDEMLRAGSDGVEVAAYYGVHPSTLYGQCESKFKMNFSEYAQEKRSSGKAFLRIAQYKKAVSGKGDSQMLKWLGIHILGQKESYKEDIKDSLMELASVFRDIQKVPRVDSDQGPDMASQQSLPHQGCSRLQDQIQTELGAAGDSCRAAYMQHHTESAPARDNDSLLHLPSGSGTLDGEPPVRNHSSHSE